MSAVEYDYEPIPGLPGDLPAGEILLWRGSPEWWPMARRALRVVPIGIYFAALALWQGYATFNSLHAWRPTLHALLIPLSLGAAVCLLLSAVGWAAARATIYTITSQRVVIRHGIALPMSLNLPFNQINSAGLRLRRDGSGDISMILPKSQRVGYLLTWPHVRPGHYAQPQPSLRGLSDASAAADILARALQACVSVKSAPDIASASPRAASHPSARTSVAA